MKVKALISFCGKLSMGKGEVIDCRDEALVKELVSAGYIERVDEPKAEPEQPAEAPASKPTKKKKAVKPDGDK